MRVTRLGETGRMNLVPVRCVKFVNHPVDAGRVNRLARRICSRRRVRVVRTARCELPNDLAGRRLDPQRHAALGCLKEHLSVNAADAHVLHQYRGRIGDAGERDLPLFAQVVDVSRRQRGFCGVVPLRAGSNPKTGQLTAHGRKQRRNDQADDNGRRGERFGHCPVGCGRSASFRRLRRYGVE